MISALESGAFHYPLQTYHPFRPCHNNAIASITRAIFPALSNSYMPRNLVLSHPHGSRQSKEGFFKSWPGLTAALVQKYLPPSIATSKGHLDQTQKKICSTTTLPPLDPDQPQETNNQQTQCLFATIQQTGNNYTDQTSRFSVTSSCGSQYVLVLYDYDYNAILTEPL